MNDASLLGTIATYRTLPMVAHATGARPCIRCVGSSSSCTTKTSFHPVSYGFLVFTTSLTRHCLEAVMDMVGHFELPACHIDPATASLEDCEYAIQLGKLCLNHYATFSETIDALMHARLTEEANSSAM